MAEKGLPAPTPKLKTKIPVAGQATKKGNISLNLRVVISRIDYNQGQNILNPPNQPVQLPEQLLNTRNQLPPPLIPANLPNQQNLQNQQNQANQQNIPNIPPSPPIPADLPNQQKSSKSAKFTSSTTSN